MDNTVNGNTWCVYSHTSPTGWVYVGITHRDPETRWGMDGVCYVRFCRGTLTQRLFAHAIMKYGWDNIKHEILFNNLSKEEACKKEQELIALYKDKGISYNITDGGVGALGLHKKHGPRPQEVRDKISRAKKGVKLSEEHRRKLALHMLGKKLPLETRLKMSETQKRIKSINNPSRKPVLMIDTLENKEYHFNSATEASKFLGVTKNCISENCLKNTLTLKRYKVSYESKGENCRTENGSNAG